MSFSQQLFLMVVDKLIIGGLLAFIVYRAQKRLETFRGEQALQNEIARKRVESLAGGWKALNAWDMAVTDLLSGFAFLLRKRLALDDQSGLDDLGLPDVVAIADWLSLQLKTNDSLIVGIKQDCEHDLKPLIQKSIECANEAKAVMQENRFWFGKALYNHCKQFHASLHQVCIAFENRDFQELPSQLKLLDKKRQNVLTVLQTVRSLPTEEPNDNKS